MDETGPFSIRADFPVALREEIVEEAKNNRLSVGEFMAAICLVSRTAGWPRVVSDGMTHGMSDGVTHRVTDLDELERLARIVATLAGQAKSRAPEVLLLRRMVLLRLQTHQEGRLISVDPA